MRKFGKVEDDYDVVVDGSLRERRKIGRRKIQQPTASAIGRMAGKPARVPAKIPNVERSIIVTAWYLMIGAKRATSRDRASKSPP
jgi:hypothetical protein